MASGMYLEGMAQMFENTIDWDDAGTTIKCALMTTGYTFDPDDDFWDDISANEVGNIISGYSVGGVEIGSKAVNRDLANDRVELDAGDAIWTGIECDIAIAAVIYKDSGTPGTSPLIAQIDIADTTPNGGDLTIQWDAEGIVQFPS